MTTALLPSTGALSSTKTAGFTSGPYVAGPQNAETIPANAWFWEPAWQIGEREADRDISEGRTTYYDTAEDFLDSL